MSFPRYEKYKDSGVEWLGEVPEHWGVQPVRSVVRHMDHRNEGAICTDYLSLMANVGVIPYEEKGEIGNKKPEDLSKCKLVKIGNLVINSMNYSIGSYGISRYEGVCSPVYVVLEINREAILSRFAFRIFQNTAFQRYAASFGNGILAHRAAIGWDELKVIGIAVPPEEEQQSILSFLDIEIQKIDALIEEQRRLIELLKEKRQAVISHAVTKGLRDDAEVFDSGIDWVGTVPRRWRIMKLGQFAKIVRGGSPRPAGDPRFFNGDFMPWITVGEVTKDDEMYLVGTDAMLTAEGATLSRQIDAGILVLTNSGATLGVPKILGITGCANDGILAFLDLSPDICQKYLYYVLGSITSDLRERVKQGSGQPNLNTGIVGSLVIPCPPAREQEEIVLQIEQSLSNFASLIAEASLAVTLLEERRSALISAAVTGKIDIRNYSPKETA